MASQDQGRLRRSNHFLKEDRMTIESSEGEQRQFRDYVLANKAFSETEKAAIQLDSIDGFANFWRQVNSAKEEFDHDLMGGNSMSKSYQETAATVYDFMQSFSPVIGIVKDFAAPYGGLAIGTLSVLFAVAKNKSDVEERLGSTISSIQDRLPGLRMYQNIYNEDRELEILLQKQIVSTYRSFIDFSIAATKYYKSPKLRQWLKAFGPQNRVVQKAKKVQDETVKMRALCEDLLNRNVDELKKSNKQLDAQLKEMQNGRDNDRVRDIQQLLDLGSFSEEVQRESMDKYHKALACDDQINAEYFQQMQGNELDLFRSEPDYQRWMTSMKPCFLILSGYNDKSISSATRHCWLSPVATALIKDLTNADKCPTLAYSILQSEMLIFDVLPVILLELLKQKSQALRNEEQYSELRSELRDFHVEVDLSISPKKRETRLIALHKVARRVINLFDESETIYIIVDRADRCKDPRGPDHRIPLLRVLAQMVEVARSNLKVLVVINGYDWPISKDLNDVAGRVRDRLIICEVEQRYRS